MDLLQKNCSEFHHGDQQNVEDQRYLHFIQNIFTIGLQFQVQCKKCFLFNPVDAVFLQLIILVYKTPAAGGGSGGPRQQVSPVMQILEPGECWRVLSSSVRFLPKSCFILSEQASEKLFPGFLQETFTQYIIAFTTFTTSLIKNMFFGRIFEKHGFSFTFLKPLLQASTCPALKYFDIE